MLCLVLVLLFGSEHSCCAFQKDAGIKYCCRLVYVFLGHPDDELFKPEVRFPEPTTSP